MIDRQWRIWNKCKWKHHLGKAFNQNSWQRLATNESKSPKNSYNDWYFPDSWIKTVCLPKLIDADSF